MSAEEKQKSDIFLITLPWWENNVPPCAPAVLKGIVESQGFTCKTYDSNIDLQWEICNNDLDLYNSLFSYFFLPQKDYPHQDLIDRFYDHVIDKIQQQDTRYVGISVFSVYTHKAVFDMLTRLKSRITVPVVLGGRGLSTRSNLSILDELSASEKLLNFSDIIKRRDLAEHIIIGDGEDALVSLLNGGRPDIGDIHHVAASPTLDYPFSNFDDMELDKYNGVGGTKQIPVISSKGCVRACDFCDVAAQMAKFQSKDGVRLAEEVIYLADRYGIFEFAMADSIVNGNMKSLTHLCERLAEYNATADKKITWSGNWISRPPNAIKPHFYDLLAASGCSTLTVGAEHASNRVLEAMHKKTVVEGIHFDLEQFDRVGIKAILNIITGHWSEHFDDYMELYDFLIKQGRYIANGTIPTFQTSTFSTLDKTPAVDHSHVTGLVRADDNFTLLWYTKKNPKSTIKIRLARFLPLIEYYYHLQISMRNNWNWLKILTSKIEQSSDSWEEFFGKNIDPNEFEVCQESLDFMENHLTYMEETAQKFFPTMPLKIRVNASCYNGSPRLFVKYNGAIIYDQELAEGSHEIAFELDNVFDRESSLEVGMTGKAPHDTQIDAQGNIVKDKCIVLEKLELDTVDVVKDYNFFYHQLEYRERNKVTGSKQGFFLNDSSLRINYCAPFWKYYLSTGKSSSWFLEKNKRAEMQELFTNLKSMIRKLKY